MPDHALGRFIQLSGGADLRSALFEAAQGYVAADVNAVLANPTALSLRAGRGAFVADLIYGTLANNDNQHCLYARARTWLADEMLDEKQRLLPVAEQPQNSIAMLLLQQSRSRSLEHYEVDRGAAAAFGCRQSRPNAGGFVGLVRSNCPRCRSETSGRASTGHRGGGVTDPVTVQGGRFRRHVRWASPITKRSSQEEGVMCDSCILARGRRGCNLRGGASAHEGFVRGGSVLEHFSGSKRSGSWNCIR